MSASGYSDEHNRSGIEIRALDGRQTSIIARHEMGEEHWLQEYTAKSSEVVLMCNRLPLVQCEEQHPDNYLEAWQCKRVRLGTVSLGHTLIEHHQKRMRIYLR